MGMRTGLRLALRFAWMPLVVSACCLDVAPDGPGSSTGIPQGVTSGAGNTGGNGTSTGTVPGTANTGTTTGGGGVSTSPACIYPAAAQGVFPDATLGDGWFDPNGAIDSTSTLA